MTNDMRVAIDQFTYTTAQVKAANRKSLKKKQFLSKKLKLQYLIKFQILQ